jgi:hypothetical protein
MKTIKPRGIYPKPPGLSSQKDSQKDSQKQENQDGRKPCKKQVDTGEIKLYITNN